LKARKAISLSKVELLVLDVDGVLTDGRLYYGPRGEIFKSFHVRDGRGLKLLQDAGVSLAAISGRKSKAVSARMRELGIKHLVQGESDKVAALQRIGARIGVDPLKCACIVDDTLDLPLMAAVGFAAAVADAHPLVIKAAHWVSRAPGGCGAVRELCDAILRARN
jgi:3-deoxy-D-manno-octulosonate 8-phosphate phosphatase (KDO 8-P phosphatase)